MNFYFYSPVAFEKWDWRNSVEKGIGGSETSHVEMAWRLAARGHNVTTYAPIPDDCPGEWRKTRWYPVDKATFTEPGIWILYRCPDVVEKFPPIKDRKDQQIWLMMQDWDYPNWTDKRIINTDRIITLCQAHGREVIKKHPLIKSNLWLSSNGIKIDLIEEIEREIKKDVIRFGFDVGQSLEDSEELRQYARDVYYAGHEVYIIPAMGSDVQVPYELWLQTMGVPFTAVHRATHAPNATLDEIAEEKLKILKNLEINYFWDDLPSNVKKAQEHGFPAYLVEKDKPIEKPKYKILRNTKRIMHASSPDRGLKQALLSFSKAREYVPDLEFHAFYGFNNLEKLAKMNKSFQSVIDELKELLNQPGVTFHGRVSQNELYREWFKSGIYIYETDFFETSNIASQEAQAMGAVPVFSPIFAQKENIKHGIGIEGGKNDPLTHARFAAELVRLATNPRLQDQIRKPMMTWARKRFNWENFVTQWEMEAKGERKKFEKQSDFPVQL